MTETASSAPDNAPDVRVSIETLTPESAMELFAEARKTNYRPFVLYNGQRIKGSIERGEWKLNGDTIKFNAYGIVTDGQHRLYAIAHGGRSVESVVVRGLPVDVDMTLGEEVPRTTAMAVRRCGLQFAPAIASALRYLFLDMAKVSPNTGNCVVKKPTIQQLMDLMDTHIGIVKAAQWCAGRKFAPIRSGTFGFLRYMTSLADKEGHMHDGFWDALSTGDGVEPESVTSAAYWLRERLVRDRVRRIGRLTSNEKLALAIKAWNAFSRGRIVPRVSWSPGREPWPEIRSPEV